MQNSLLSLYQKSVMRKKHLPFGHGVQHVFKNLIMSKRERSSDKEVYFLKNRVKNHYCHRVKKCNKVKYMPFRRENAIHFFKKYKYVYNILIKMKKM